MSGDPVQAIDPEVLRNHALHLEQIDDGDIADAIGAAGLTDVSDGAFGKLCSSLVPGQSSATTSCSDVIGRLSTMLTTTSQNVRTWANTAEEHEADVAALFNQEHDEWEA